MTTPAGEARSITRVAAPEIEAVVLQGLGIDVRGPKPHQGDPGDTTLASDLAEQLHDRVERITLMEGSLEITPRQTEDVPTPQTLIIPLSPAPSRRRRAILRGDEESHTTIRPIRAETRARLISGIANARAWLDELGSGRTADAKAIAAREGCSERHVRSTLNLAFLAPTIVQAAINGTLPDGCGVVSMMELSANWDRQHASLE